MTQTGTVNYHVHKPFRQAFEIDVDGIVGNLIEPEFSSAQIALLDQRNGEATTEFAEDGFAFASSPTGIVEFHGDTWQGQYDVEMADVLTREIDAKEVITFDHTVRIDDPQAKRRPARHVHSDYSRDGAEKRLVDILGREKADEWAQGHYAFINIWRPIANPINSAPLGFVRPSTVSDADWIVIDLIYPDRRGQVMGLANDAQHEWIYRSRMTPDEVAFFNIYDNSGHPCVGHSAIDLVEDPAITTPRQSIESRTLVRY
jgi:hypothetical protein